jgi:hypothetical protein
VNGHRVTANFPADRHLCARCAEVAVATGAMSRMDTEILLAHQPTVRDYDDLIDLLRRDTDAAVARALGASLRTVVRASRTGCARSARGPASTSATASRSGRPRRALRRWRIVASVALPTRAAPLVRADAPRREAARWPRPRRAAHRRREGPSHPARLPYSARAQHLYSPACVTVKSHVASRAHSPSFSPYQVTT